MSIRSCLIAFVPVILLLTSLDASAKKHNGDNVVEIPCLDGEVEVILDRDGVPHIFAENDHDLLCAEGYVHARDRFFQMDLTRREVSGDLAELLGPSRARQRHPEPHHRSTPSGGAQRSRCSRPTRWRCSRPMRTASMPTSANNPLPIEYGLLELTTVRPWDPIDSLVIGKAIAASLSLDIDIGPTLQLQAFIEAGAAGGFDGQALFFEDVRRAAPMDPASTVPDATGAAALPRQGAAR